MKILDTLLAYTNDVHPRQDKTKYQRLESPSITHSTYKDAKGSKSSLQANTPPLEERIKIDKAKVLHEGHSQVFEGQCDPNGTGEWKRCVVKKITKRAGFNEKEKQSREIEALNEFGRKKEYEEHIAKFYCSYENEDFWFIANELLDCSLSSFIEEMEKGKSTKNRLLQLKQRLPLAKQAAIALKWVHNNSWVHKDIKPSNYVIKRPTDPTKEPTCKLTDLGYAKAMQVGKGYTSLTTQLGSFSYTAPELTVITDKESVHFKMEHDVWALGCVLHEILTGLHPFGNPKDVPQTGMNIRIGKKTENAIEELSEVNNYITSDKLGVTELINKMISLTASQRPTMEEVVNEMSKWKLNEISYEPSVSSTLKNVNKRRNKAVEDDNPDVSSTWGYLMICTVVGGCMFIFIVFCLKKKYRFSLRKTFK